MNIGPKLNVSTRLESELVYYDVIVHYVSHCVTEISLVKLKDRHCCNSNMFLVRFQLLFAFAMYFPLFQIFIALRLSDWVMIK